MHRLWQALSQTVRWRLTLWYTLVLCLTFAIFSVVVDRLTTSHLYAQADRQLADTLTAVSRSLDQAYRENLPPASGHMQEEIAELGLPADMLLQVSWPDGTVNYLNTRSLPVALMEWARNIKAESNSPVTIFDGARQWRVAQLIQHVDANAEYQVLLARDLAPLATQLQSLRRTLLITLPLILLLAAVGGYFLAARALRPVAQIAAQARHIEARALHERLEVPRTDDEFGQLARVLNDLFARLERAFQYQRQFLADAAHELRTPVAILRSQADVALERPRLAEDYAVTLTAMRAETEQLSALVDNLLLIARADAEQLPLSMESLDVMEVVDDACRAVRPLAQSKQLTLHWEIGDEISVHGDARLLRRAVINVLTNAIKYTMPGGEIIIAVEREANGAAISVTDTGIGLAPEDMPHIFERFYRADRSLLAHEEGSGLGLAIVKMIAELHTGQVKVESVFGEGSRFTIFIPSATVEAEAVWER